MDTSKTYNYEDFMISLNSVLDLLETAIKSQRGLSLSRFGHAELAYIGSVDFPEWKYGIDPHSFYAGATASDKTLQQELRQALKASDIVGFHASWSHSPDDRDAARKTSILLKQLIIRPKHICDAYITHHMIESDRFWKLLKNRKVALVGRRAKEAYAAFKNKGIDVSYITTLEGYQEIDKVYNDLSGRQDWDIAIVAAGIPATILAPKLAEKSNKVVIDFGHALDMVIDGESFNYDKLLKDWKEASRKNMLVSIVMAVYNGELFIKEAIDSALSQTYKNIELIIVNDGSRDSTKRIIDSVKDKRTIAIHLEKNQGAANALNKGIEKAKGSWIAILDADDKFHPHKIEEQLEYASLHPDLIGIGTFIRCMPGEQEVSKDLLQGVARHKNSYAAREDIRKAMYWGSPLTHSAVMFKRDAFMEVGGYDTAYKIAYDYDLWIKLMEKGEIENIPKILTDYRVHLQSLSNKNGIATVNEIQTASSKGIYRLLCNKGKKQPNVVVIGPIKACKNYTENIAPSTNLSVKALNFREWQRKVSEAVKQIRLGRMDALIILDNKSTGRMIEKYAEKYLKLNENLFFIYNIIN